MPPIKLHGPDPNPRGLFPKRPCTLPHVHARPFAVHKSRVSLKFERIRGTQVVNESEDAENADAQQRKKRGAFVPPSQKKNKRAPRGKRQHPTARKRIEM